MPRSRNVYNTEFPYHIVARTNDGVHFPCKLSEAWGIYQNALLFYSKVFHTRVLAFVMMSNHFHLLMTTPEGNLSLFMKHFMKRTSDEIRSLRDCKNHLYGDRYYPSLITSQSYFAAVLKYVYQNPIRAKLCHSILDYPYSTLPELLGFEKMVIPVFDDFGFFDDPDGHLRWLDERYETEEVGLIKKGLTLQEFKFSRDSSSYMHDLHDTLPPEPTSLTHRHA